MKYWSEVVQASLYKLFIDDTDDDADEYTNKMPYVANECLNMIANDIKPKWCEITIKTFPKLVLGSNFEVEDGVITYEVGEDTIVTTVRTDTIYREGEDNYIYENDDLVKKYNVAHITDIIKMPDDFITFADRSPILTKINRYKKAEIISKPNIVYKAWNKIILPEVGEYNIFYNGRYGEIPLNIAYIDEDIWTNFDLTRSYTREEYNEIFNLTESGDPTEIVFNGIDKSILECLPTYIASSLLEQDDLQRAMLLRNEFESMAQRLEDNEFYQIEHFTSPGGWY